jgi:hypothetical protein
MKINKSKKNWKITKKPTYILKNITVSNKKKTNKFNKFNR